MKRNVAIGMVVLLCLIASVGFAQESTVTEEWTIDGLTVNRNHIVTDTQAIDYPTFETDNPLLATYLDQAISQPIQILCEAQDGVFVRCGFTIAMDFPPILSVEASITQVTTDGTVLPTQFFSLFVDIDQVTAVALWDLFTQTEEECQWLINEAVLQKADSYDILIDYVQAPELVPVADSSYIFADGLRVLYAAGNLATSDVALDLSWEELGLTQSSVITGVTPTPELTATPTMTPTPTPTQTIDLDNTLSPVETTTPMPLGAEDEIIAQVLQRGVWKQLGSDGNTYYQFMEDGTMLTITVSNYTLEEGVLTASSMTGTMDVGSESAFTLYGQDGSMTGYVLNRAGEQVAPEEFVTPTPSPVPTATPTAEPTPTPSPTNTAVPTLAPTPSPTPTPGPTPTLSPYEEAVETAPSIAAISASFANARSLEVYSAPDESAYRVSGAIVTTNSAVTIYGVEGDWVLVSYLIGDGTKGRMGYIENSTLDDPDSVAELDFIAMEMTLTADADATDDPLQAKGTITSLSAGDSVTLLAFMPDQWAYIETTFEGQTCRLFIPQSALMQEGA